MARVTQESDPDFWQTLYDQWLAEGRPGWVVRGGGMQSWTVLQLVDGSIVFDTDNPKDLYESTSFG
jgi:hypothetical protein